MNKTQCNKVEHAAILVDKIELGMKMHQTKGWGSTYCRKDDGMFEAL